MEDVKLDQIIESNGRSRTSIISILQELQSIHNYLPEKDLCYISEKLEIPLIDLFSIASFYKAFNLTPRGKHLIQVCLGTACHVRGAVPILEEFERKLHIRPDETTEDMQLSLKTVNCLGACSLGPIVVVDQDYHGNTSIQQVEEILINYGYVKQEEPESKE